MSREIPVQTPASSEIPRVEIECQRVTKRYTDGETEITAIEEFSETFVPGELVAITGPSGSGKSTLLSMLGALTFPDEGSLLFRTETSESDLDSFSTEEQIAFRAEWVSFLYPEFNLLPMLSVYENIALSLSVKRMPEPEIDARIKQSLAELGIEALTYRQPPRLSTGERSRAALARAIAGGNPVLLVDEPTAHLDAEAAATVTETLASLAVDGPRIVLVATHDPLVVGRASRSVTMRATA